MAESTGSVGGVGGSGGSKSAESAASAAASQADNMVDAATGPTGVDIDAIGKTLSGLQAQAPAGFAQSIQAAVEAQLSPVQAGQLQSAIDKATMEGALPSLADQLARSPLADLAPKNDVLNSDIHNTAGQLVDQCGTVVTTASAARPDPLADSVRKAVQHIGRSVSGPVSGLAYSAATIAGADQKTLDNVHAVGKMLDGIAEPVKSRAMKPAYENRMPTPAHQNYFQR